jgi:uncharacterized membrane protein YgcG
MDLSSQSNQSEDEARIMKRQLYRPGQSPEAAKTPTPATSRSAAIAPGVPARKTPAKGGDKSSQGPRVLIGILTLGVGYYLLFGTPTQRRRVGIGLGLTAWLLLLGGISYCLCIPGVNDVKRAIAAIDADDSLSMEQKFEKKGEVFWNMTPAQKMEMRKEGIRKANRDMQDFLHMTPEQQMEELRKDEERRKQWRAKMPKRRPGGDPNGGGQKGGGQKGGQGKGPGGGGGGGWGGGPGGGGGGGMMDSMSPETRAGMGYKQGLREQMRQQNGGGGGK